MWTIIAIISIIYGLWFLKYPKVLNSNKNTYGEWREPYNWHPIKLSILKILLVIIIGILPIINIVCIIVTLFVIGIECSVYGSTEEILGFENKFWKFLTKDF